MRWCLRISSGAGSICADERPVSGLPAPGGAFLDHHLAWHPVDATFMGIAGHDDRLPRADTAAARDERLAIAATRALVRDALPRNAGERTIPRDAGERTIPPDAGERADRRIALGELDCAEAALDHRRRWHNPAWYTGEASFGLLGLLLPQASPYRLDAVRARLRALPDFLSDGSARLREAGAAPAGWVARACREARATARFLEDGLIRHAAWQPVLGREASAASAAFEEFARAVEPLPDRDPAAGRDMLSRIMSSLHGLDQGPEALAQSAQAAFDRLGAALVEQAARLDPRRSWQQILDSLNHRHPHDVHEVLPRYRSWHEAAVAAADGLVTPETGYGLDYRILDEPFRALASELYFLSYRSPPPAAPGGASVYWVTPPQAGTLSVHNDATIKLIHAVHHGSIGHHTHNARARTCASVLGRVAGTDCASGIALLSGGMIVEGWACHAEDLLTEAQGFYDDAETLLLMQYERRNAASVLVDVRLHTGVWSLREAARFYRDEAGFAPSRVDAEIVRNSMFPGSRLMYWAGVEAIRALRRRWQGDTRAFHDALLSYGHVPACVIEAEMTRLGQLG